MYRFPQAMTPPEYGLDEFVDGVEALDDDEIEDDGHKVCYFVSCFVEASPSIVPQGVFV